MPRSPEILGLSAQVDPNNQNTKPRLVYLQDTQFPQTILKHYLLLRGQEDLEHHNTRNYRFIGITQDQNRRTNGIATLWEVDLIEAAAPEPQPEPQKPKHVELPSPESLMAIADHEKKLSLEKERLSLEEAQFKGETVELTTIDEEMPIQEIKDAVATETVPVQEEQKIEVQKTQTAVLEKPSKPLKRGPGRPKKTL